MLQRFTRWGRRLDRQELLSCGLLAATLLLVSATPLVVSFAVSPTDIESGRVRLTPPCPHRGLTGIDCPSCGMTRALTALGHGHLRAAHRYHRGALPLYGGLWVVALASAVSLYAVSRRLATIRRRTAKPASQHEAAAATPAAGTHA